MHNQSAFVKIEEFFDKERAHLSAKKEEKAGMEQMGTNRDFGQAAGSGKERGNIMKQETAKKAIGQSAKFLRWGGGWRGVGLLFP
ncbi:MAG: hypothetical protein ACLRXC_11725 [[Clostridium] leptum]